MERSPSDGVAATDVATPVGIRARLVRADSTVISRAMRGLAGTSSLLIGALLAGMIVVVLVGVYSRYVVNDAVPWVEDLSRLLFLYLVFVGAAVATYDASHVAVDSAIRRFSDRGRAIARFISNGLTVAAGCLLAVHGAIFSNSIAWLRSHALDLSAQWFFASVAVGGLLMVVYAMARPLAEGETRPGRALATLAGVVAATLVSVAEPALEAGGFTPLLLVVVTFVGLLLLGVPIAITMLASALTLMVSRGGTPLEVVPQNMGVGVDSFTLLAVPFFILAGTLMERGGISQRLVAWVRSMIGHVRGGLGIVVVLSEYLFSGISGSTTADVSAIGSVTIPAMVKAGYTPALSVSIVATSAALGILVPPSIAMIFVAILTGESVGALFAAGFLPAAVMAALLIGFIYLRAPHWGLPSDSRATVPELLRTSRGAVIPLLMPVILFGAIFGGIATPTEASAIAVVYALGVGLFVYREIRWSDLPRIFVGAAKITAIVMFLLGAASVLTWNLAHEGLPSTIARGMISLSSSPLLFFLISILLIVVLSAILEGLPTLLVLIPLLLPIAEQFGIDPLHFAIVAIAAQGIGVFIPPIGIGIILASSIGRISVGSIIGPFAPFFGILILGLLVITLVPWFTLVVPDLLFTR